MRASFISQTDLLSEQAALEKIVASAVAEINKLTKEIDATVEAVVVKSSTVGRLKNDRKYYIKETGTVRVLGEIERKVNKKFQIKMASLEAARYAANKLRNNAACQLHAVTNLLNARARNEL